MPFVELIWCYWKEEGVLVQTMNHILARFQNRRIRAAATPLARFDLNPLLPLRNLLFGWAEEEVDRLTVRRRAAEYEYEYGLRPASAGPCPPSARWWSGARQFLEAFHTLLHAALVFYKERDDKTVDADAFPLLNACGRCTWCSPRARTTSSPTLPVAARARDAGDAVDPGPARDAATSSAAGRWCPTRRRGWTASTP